MSLAKWQKLRVLELKSVLVRIGILHLGGSKTDLIHRILDYADKSPDNLKKCDDLHVEMLAQLQSTRLRTAPRTTFRRSYPSKGRGMYGDRELLKYLCSSEVFDFQDEEELQHMSMMSSFQIPSQSSSQQQNFQVTFKLDPFYVFVNELYQKVIPGTSISSTIQH